MPENFKYNDTYVDVTSAEALIDQLSGTISSITEKAYAPTNVTDMTGEHTGYITFTDTIGDLMEVKGFKSILWVDHKPDSPTYGDEIEYTNVSKSTSGNVDTYVFNGTVHSSWLYNYEDTSLNNIIITVDHSGANDVVTIKIPPALLPMVEYRVTKTRTGIDAWRNEETRPVKINYIVGPKEGVIDQIAGRRDVSDATLKAQIDAYVANSANKVTTSDNKSGIALYPNSWRGSEETTVPVADFGINSLNSYYSFAARTQLYTDSSCQHPATSFEAGTTYYYEKIVYHIDNGTEEKAHLTVKNLVASDTEVIGGQLYAKAGADKDLPANTSKSENATGTRSYQLSSHWQNGTNVHQHQGNNGRLVVEQPGELQIDKTLTVDDGVTEADEDKMAAKEFTFKVDLKNSQNADLSGSFNYVISDPHVAEANWGTISSGDTLKIKEDETILVKGLPVGTKYTVSEQDVPAGYTLKKIDGEDVQPTGTATGTIKSAETSAHEFTNNYSFEGHAQLLSERPHVKKTLSGREISTTDEFVMRMVPYASNPDGATVLSQTVTVKKNAGETEIDPYNIDASFQGVRFTQPGTYQFRISEIPGTISGITYSQSVYSYKVVVVDNGDGTMSINSDLSSADPGITMEKTVDVDGTSVPEGQGKVDPVIVDGHQVLEATFTNTYNAQEITIGTPGEKNFTDNSGANPLKANMFEFEIRPSFYDADGNELTQREVSAVPMPEGTDETTYTDADTGLQYRKKDTFNSATGDFGFGLITYGPDDVDKTYRYVVQEIIPDDALTGGTKLYVKRGDPDTTIETTVNHGYLWHNPDDGNAIYDLRTITYKGYVYDCSRHVVTVKVTEEEGHIVAKVEYSRPESVGANKVEINNEYTPEPVKTDDDDTTGNNIKFAKKLVGRDSKPNEKFTFTMTASGANAQTAISRGYIVMPGGGTTATAEVDNLTDGTAKDVYFEGIEFKRPGTYTFSIAENAGSASGMTYDAHTLVAVIKIIDDEGTLKIGSIDYTGSKTFTNTYTTADVDFGAGGAVQIEKRVDGRAMIAGKYEFRITGDDAASRDKIEEITEDGSNIITVRNASSAADGIEQGTQAMTGMRFTQADAGKTFSYTATEVIPRGATQNPDGTYTYQGVTYAYDGKGSQKFTFKVTDEGDGTLSVLAKNLTTGEEVTSKSHEEIKPLELHFANKYEYTPLVYPSTTYTKKIEGRPWKEGDEFKFKLVASGDAPEPERTEATVSYGQESDDTVTFKFGDATFTKPGTYTYRVLENGVDGQPGSGGTKEGLSFDTHACTIQVIITDNDDGTLSARVSGNAADRQFVNVYHAEIDFDGDDDGTNVAEAEKLFEQRPIRDREFMIDVRPFEVLDEEGEVKEGYASAAETTLRFLTHYDASSFFAKDGNIASVISGMTFNEKDAGKTYAFEVREFIPAEAENGDGVKYSEATDAQKAAGGFSLDGITYNTNGIDHYRLDITTIDNGDGTLSVKTKWIAHDFYHEEIAGGGEVTSTTGEIKTAKLEFKNDYAAEAVATINTVKDLEGRAWKDSDLFEFKIERMKYDKANNTLVEDSEDELTTPLPDYNIKATNKTDAVGSDGSQHHAVKDPDAVNKENGWKLNIDASDLEEVDGKMQGDFFYRITEVVPGNAKNADGIEYSQATPEQKAAGGFTLKGVRYSSTPRYVHVHAQDLMTGRLTTDVDYVSKDAPMTDLGTSPVFTNYYTATDELEIPLTKVLEGRDWKAGDSFTFVLTGAESSTPMPAEAGGDTLTIDDVDGSENHSGSFGKIKFTEPGTYTYFIAEQTESEIPGVEYDEYDERRVVVEVADNGDGTMIKEITYYTDMPMFNDTQQEYNGVNDRAQFTNVYKTSSDEIDTYADGEGIFASKKKIEGRRFREGDMFTFTIEGPEGVALPSETEKTVYPEAGQEEVSFGFGTIKFTGADLARSPIVYTIKETRGTTAGITYDSHEEKVRVTLTDDGEGHISATAEKINNSPEPTPDEVKFINTYESTGTAKIGVIKDLQGRGEKGWQESDNFTFAIERIEGTGTDWADYTTAADQTPLPDNGRDGNRAVATNDTTEIAEGQYFAKPEWVLELDQDDLSYDENTKRMTGDYYYKLTEIIPADAKNAAGKTYAEANDSEKAAGGFVKAGITYDSTPRYAHVRAVDNGYGGIGITVYYDEDTPGDTSSAVGATPVFSNEYKSPTGSIEVTKVWDDKDNQDGKRTDAVMHLFKQVPKTDGGAKLVQVEVEKMTLATGDDHDQNMSGTWTDLPIYDNDGTTKITYVVQEEAIAGYKQTISPATLTLSEDDKDKQVRVTNKYDAATTEVKVTKNWDDNNNQAGLRPESVRVNLKNGSETVDTRLLTENNNWTYTFTGLDKMADGVQIDYTVEEEALDSSLGYDAAVVTGCQSKGYTITNTRKPTYRDVTVTKVWDDNDNQDGIRPNYVEMQLYKKIGASGTSEAVTGKTIRVTGDDTEDRWTGTISGLLRYEQGREVIYTFDEVSAPGGYTKTVSADGLTITNTHTESKGTLNIVKYWDDNSDQDKKRPSDADFVSALTLKADGTAVTGVTPTVSTEGNNTTVTWEGLNVYGAGGTKIKYTVEEAAIDGYTLISNSGEAELTQGQTATINLRNHHDTGTKSVHFTKVWSDGSNQDGTRPAADEFAGWITLYDQYGREIERAEVEKTVDTSNANAWTVTWDGLYTHIPEGAPHAGEDAVYHAVEDAAKAEAKGYSAEYDNSRSTHPDATGNEVYDGGTITNTHTTSKVKIHGTKKWADDTGFENMRPDSVKVEVLDGTRVVDTVTVEKGTDGWAASTAFESKELPKYRSGEEITYTVREQNVTGYATKYDGGTGTETDPYVITNALETASISGVKLWNDNNNAKGLRPAAITINVKNGDTVVKSVEVRGTENSWNYAVAGLPKYNKADGSTADYTVEEEAVPEYRTSYYNKFTIVNTLKTHDITGTKVWVDGGKKHDNTTEVELEVYRGTGTAGNVTWEQDALPESRYHVDWKGNEYTITGLADTDTAGNNFFYKVVEANTPSGYTVTYDNAGATIPGLTDGASNGGKIKNTIDQDQSAKLDLVIEKKITGREFRKGDSFTFELNATTGTPLPKDQNGNDVTEVTITPKTGSKAEANFGTITYVNANIPDQGITYEYKIKEKVPSETDGITYDTTEKTVSVNVKRVDGILTVTATPGAAPYASFTNRYDDLTGDRVTAELKATKALNRNFNSNDKFRFMITAADGTPMPENTVVTLENLDSSESRKTFSFGNVTYELDDLDGDSSKVFTYTLVETAANQSGITYDENALKLYVKVTRNKSTGKLVAEYSADGSSYVPSIDSITPTFTNKYESPEVKGGITVIKKWDDANDQDGLRPEKITVILKNENGVERARADLTEKSNWTHTFDVPQYEDDGQTEIKYSAEEVALDEALKYDEPVIEGTGTKNDPFVITNKHTPESAGEDDPDHPGKKIVTATKVWDDDDDKLGMRDDVTLRLIGKVTVDGSEKVVYSEAKKIEKGSSSLKVSWSDVPKNYNGKKIEYEVTEEAVFGYTTEVTGSASEGFTVKNTLSTGITSTIKVSKEWQDADNVDGIRPDKLTFKLMHKIGNDDPAVRSTKTVDVASDGTCGYVWEDLPVEKNGETILYSVEEEPVEGYDSHVQAVAPGEFVAVNTHKPDTYGDPDGPTDPKDPEFSGIKVTKVWSDERDAHGNRPDHVVFHLLANGEDTGMSQIALGEGKGTSWDAVGWTGLPKNDKDGAIKYSVKEDEVSGYNAAVAGNPSDGFTVTNTYDTSSKSIKLVIVKEWRDKNGNVISKAPAAAKIHVMKKAKGHGAEEAESFTFKKDASGDALTKTFKDMPTVENKLDITYSIKEDRIVGYKTSYEDGVYSDDGKTLTLKVVNTKRPDTPEDNTPVILQFVDPLNDEGTQIVSATNSTFGQAKKLADVKPEKDPKHAGYDFQQWDMNYATTENGDVTVVYVARYQSGMKVVSYVNGQAEKGKVLIKTEKTLDPSKVADPAEDPVHEGCTFVGSQEVEDAAGNIIRVAKFEPKKCPPSDKNHCYVDPSVRKAIKGQPKTTPKFTFTFSSVTKDAPMPEGSKNGKKTMTLSGGGEIEFGWIEYNEEGTYEYAITEERDKAKDWKYERSKFRMVVEVTRDEEGNLTGERTLYKDGKKITNMTTAVFTNTYTGDDKDSGDYYDDDDDDNDPDGDNKKKKGGDGSSSIIGLPKTSDNAMLLFWVVLLIVAGLIFTGVIAKRHRKK